ncbi:MAG: hypothetical protein PHU85_06980 [Phycisphaerae bacterium]|nr:hypothetical protein [Phycisphaerae bacterium]
MPLNPLMLVMKAQNSRLARWLLGLNNFSIMPTRPGEDPMARIKARMATTLSGLVALMFTVVVGLVAGMTALLARSHRPVGWVLATCGGLLLAFTVLSWVRSRSCRLPDPGVIVVSAVLNALAVAGGVAILMRYAN